MNDRRREAFELARIGVRELELGAATRLEGGRLLVDGVALADELGRSVAGLRGVRVHVARPGESCRIVAVKDVVEPRIEVSGERPGEGRVQALSGMAVVTCGRMVGFQEGVIDLSGPGADHGPFSKLLLLVVECEPEPGLSPHEHEAAVRTAGLAAAERLAGLAVGRDADALERFAWEENVSPTLPRVAYVAMLLSQGLLHDSYVLGENARDAVPRAIDPRATFEGAIVSGNCVSACDKNTTWHHQNDPIARELLRLHGAELNLVGTVLTNEPTRLAEKQRSAERAVALVRELGAEGAVLAKEGFGNPDADLMLLIRGLEAAGIRTVALSDEFAGADGSSQSLADATPEADAIVSVGNANARIVLPALERTLGPVADVGHLAGGHARSLREDGSIEVELQALVGATNQLGEGRLSCREI